MNNNKLKIGLEHFLLLLTVICMIILGLGFIATMAGYLPLQCAMFHVIIGILLYHLVVWYFEHEEEKERRKRVRDKQIEEQKQAAIETE